MRFSSVGLRHRSCRCRFRYIPQRRPLGSPAVYYVYIRFKKKKKKACNEMKWPILCQGQAQCLISIPFIFTVSVSFLLWLIHLLVPRTLAMTHMSTDLIPYFFLPRWWLTSLAPVCVDGWRRLCDLKMAAASSRKWSKVADSFSALETQRQWHHQWKDTGISVLEHITSFYTCYRIMYPGNWAWHQE